MALIGKIRNNMWLVFVIIALATASFILMDAMGPGGGQGGTMNAAVGTVGGEKIEQMEFERTFQTLFGNSGDPNAGREALWNYLIDKTIVEKEANDLGMSVGYDELMDLQFGTNLSPIIFQNFTNPQTGQLEFEQLQNIKTQLEAGTVTNPQFAQFWREQEKQIQTTQLQTKLNSLAQKAIYTPNWLAEAAYKQENSTVDIAFVKVPFDMIEAGDITVSDQDILAYAQEDREAFELEEENRVLEYVSYDVLPTGADTSRWETEVAGMIDRFRSTPNDSAFAVANNGFYSPLYRKVEEIDEFYQDKIGSFEVGKAYGPYLLGGAYQGVKLIDKRVIPDSVKASHILRRVTPGDEAQLAEANRLIDSLYTVVNNSKGKFAEMAIAFSEDASNSADGGDLGYFAQGRMVKPFNDMAFLEGREGNVYKVQTSFGIHLIYIQDQKYLSREPKYRLAYVGAQIVPSKETQDDGYNVMLDLISSYPYLPELREAINTTPGLRMSNSGNLGPNDYQIDNLVSGTTTRDMVKFAFEKGTSVGDVSPTIYQFNDPVAYYTNKYVVAALSEIIPAGMPPVSNLRNQVEFAVLNKKKGEQAVASISGSDLSTIA
ncbi:MAG: peptidylprolyl isomerase, partial [Bacteroidota bacterium]